MRLPFKFFFPLVAILVGLAANALAEPKPPLDGTTRAIELFTQGKRAEGEALLLSLSQSGDKVATATLGGLYVEWGRPARAIELLEPLAKAGDLDAQLSLARAYATLSPPNEERARYWIASSARGGNAKAIAALKNGPGPQVAADGTVSTDEFVSNLRALMADKVPGLSDKTVACYGASRPQLLAFFNEALERCKNALPPNLQHRAVASQEFVRGLSSCANQGLFDRTGKTPVGLSACFSAK